MATNRKFAVFERHTDNYKGGKAFSFVGISVGASGLTALESLYGRKKLAILGRTSDGKAVYYVKAEPWRILAAFDKVAFDKRIARAKELSKEKALAEAAAREEIKPMPETNIRENLQKLADSGRTIPPPIAGERMIGHLGLVQPPCRGAEVDIEPDPFADPDPDPRSFIDVHYYD